MTWVQLGLAAVIAIPAAVAVAMIFWPSDYSAPPTGEDPEPTRPLRRPLVGTKWARNVTKPGDF